MPVKPATKTANVCANLYVGEFMLNFDCVGVEICQYALCEIMPPEAESKCTYYDYGSCICAAAKYAALKLLRDRLAKEMQQLDEEELR